MTWNIKLAFQDIKRLLDAPFSETEFLDLSDLRVSYKALSRPRRRAVLRRLGDRLQNELVCRGLPLPPKRRHQVAAAVAAVLLGAVTPQGAGAEVAVAEGAEFLVKIVGGDSLAIARNSEGQVQATESQKSIPRLMPCADVRFMTIKVVNPNVDPGIDMPKVTAQEFKLLIEPVIVAGSSGNEFVTGSEFAGRSFGNAGMDSLSGGADSDILLAGDVMDSLSGGAGSDTLLGGDVMDSLSGGAGHDILSGGGGMDTPTATPSLDQQLDSQMGLVPSTPQAPAAASPSVKIAPTTPQGATGGSKGTPPTDDNLPAIQKPGISAPPAIPTTPQSNTSSVNPAVGQKVAPQHTGQQISPAVKTMKATQGLTVPTQKTDTRYQELLAPSAPVGGAMRTLVCGRECPYTKSR